MLASFDAVAAEYDATFTHTAVGQKQRERVWQLLQENDFLKQPKRILEINCGTGEDALWQAKNGHEILATDLSENMLAMAFQKLENSTYSKQISLRQADIEQLDLLIPEGPFDLIFSNFGGLNCLSPKALGHFIKQTHSLLKPNGRLILVVMPEFCIWETTYFLLKRKYKNAFRRQHSPVTAWLNGEAQSVYYYSPAFFRKNCHHLFELKKNVPVGLFLPPSYLAHFFQHKNLLLNSLENMEKLLPNWEWLTACSDHAYLELVRIP